MTTLTLAAVIAALTPTLASADASPEAPWSISFELWGGRSRYDVLGLRNNVATVRSGDLLDGNFNTRGAQALLRIGWLDLGALWEGNWPKSGADSVVVTPLVGFKWDLSDTWRVDLLGELGGHRVSNIGQSGVTELKSVWLPSVGVRPSLTLRAPLGPSRFLVSLTPFARWDLLRKTVNVNVVGQTNQVQSYDVGGSTMGVVLGIGLEL
jgi:hypothetical protein